MNFKMNKDFISVVGPPAIEILKIIITLINSFVLAYYLGPELLAINISCALILRYGVYTQIGLFTGFSFLGLDALKAGDRQAYCEAQNTALSSQLLIVLLIFIMIIPIVLSYDLREEFFVGIVSYFISLLLYAIFNMLEATIRFQEKFSTALKAVIIQPILNLIFVCVFLYYDFNVYSVFISLPLSFCIVNFYLLQYVQFKIHINFVIAKSLIKAGFKLFIVNSVIGFVINLDKLLIINNYSLKQIGIFGSMTALALMIPTVGQKGSFIIFQRFKKSNVSKSGRGLEKIHTLFLLFIIFNYLVTIMSLLCFAIIIKNYLPDYLPGIPLLVYMLSWAFLLSSYWFCNYYLAALDDKKKLTFGLALSSILTALSFFIVSSSKVELPIEYFIFPKIIFAFILLGLATIEVLKSQLTYAICALFVIALLTASYLLFASFLEEISLDILTSSDIVILVSLIFSCYLIFFISKFVKTMGELK